MFCPHPFGFYLLLSMTATFVCGAPAPEMPPTSTSPDVTSAQLLKIAPTSASCNASAQFADECRTADQSVPFINKAFTKFGISTKGEKAALLSLMLFETGDFKFDKNHFPPPGRPGQGTRNLMLFPFVLEYARETPSVANQAENLVGDKSADDPSITDDTKNAVRALVLEDDLSFASAMWFYKGRGTDGKGCTGDASLVSGLQSQSRAGWEKYITQCVGTTVTDDRAAVWQAAINTLL